MRVFGLSEGDTFDHQSHRERPPCAPATALLHWSSTPTTEWAEPITCLRSPRASSPRLGARSEPSPSRTRSGPNTTESEFWGQSTQASSIQVRASGCPPFSPVSPTYNSLCQNYCSYIINMQNWGGSRRRDKTPGIIYESPTHTLGLYLLNEWPGPAISPGIYLSPGAEDTRT